MKRVLVIAFVISSLLSSAPAKGDDFNDAVKLVERFYHVKHKTIPFIARAGIKTTTTIARMAGGPKRQLAEAGSVKAVWFEDQEFTPSGNSAEFKATMNTALTASWSPLVQTTTAAAQEQTHVYLREAGEKFQVLVMNIGRREGSVVQVTLSPQTLATLMRDPDELGNSITAEATTNDQ